MGINRGESPRYASFLIRLWLFTSREDQKEMCRIELESPGTGQRKVFSSLEEACAFLQELAVEVGGQPHRFGGDHDEAN